MAANAVPDSENILPIERILDSLRESAGKAEQSTLTGLRAMLKEKLERRVEDRFAHRPIVKNVADILAAGLALKFPSSEAANRVADSYVKVREAEKAANEDEYRKAAVYIGLLSGFQLYSLFGKLNLKNLKLKTILDEIRRLGSKSVPLSQRYV